MTNFVLEKKSPHYLSLLHMFSAPGDKLDLFMEANNISEGPEFRGSYSTFDEFNKFTMKWSRV